MVIGITGNSGSGKTTLTNILGKEYDAYIIDADQVAKEMSKSGEPYFKEIIKYFGEDILLQNGEINRPKLANIIFTNNEKKKTLDLLTFQYVAEKIKLMLNSTKNGMVIIDAALLIESKLNKICDIIISVLANKEMRIERICKRDKISKDVAIERINAQPKDDFYIDNSQVVVMNNNTNELDKQMQYIKKVIEGEKSKNV